MRKVLRILLFVVFSAAGYLIALRLGYPNSYYGAATGAVCALLVILAEWALGRFSAREILAGSTGLAIGLIVANLSAFFLTRLPFLSRVKVFVYVFANLMIGYLGLTLVLRKRTEMTFLDLFFRPVTLKPEGSLKILDTSVIIDGRILDIVATGFIEGAVIVPTFVLQELQYIADSPDPLKRARGRRGLDILKRLQEMAGVTVHLDDTEVEGVEEVDSKLVKLAELKGAKILTNDYNLNKVAELHGVPVLNINELASSLKEVFLPGEELRVKVVRRGKEMGQGVGFLEDGTMVVVEAGSTKIGRTVTCVVTSMLQTTAGRMIFSKLKEE